MRQISIVIAGNSHINLPSLKKLLGQQMSPECFRVERAQEPFDEPYPYDYGRARAEELATKLGLKYKTPLCVAVVGAELVPDQPGLKPSHLELAVTIERGELKPPLALSPVATRNDTKPQAYAHWRPNQMHFAAEAAQTLAATIKGLHQSLHLI